MRKHAVDFKCSKIKTEFMTSVREVPNLQFGAPAESGKHQEHKPVERSLYPTDCWALDYSFGV